MAREINMTRAYHFVPTEFALQDIRHRRLKIARLDELNDPFELWAIAQPDRRLRDALRHTKDQMAQCYGVLCFSLAWHNPLLWSHYADRHRGIALGFDVSDEILERISYVEERATLTRIEFETAKSLLFTKYVDWKYEQEARIFVSLDEQDASGLYFGDFNERLILREVIVGTLCRVTSSDLNESLANREGVTFTKARLAFNTFQIVGDQRGLP